MVIKNTTAMDGSSLPIREFKLEWLVPNPAICMIAKRGSGKSVLVQEILEHLDSKSGIPGGMIISPTDKMSTFYGDFIPDLYVHYQYDHDLIADVLYRQEMMIAKCKQKMKVKRKVDPRAFIVMDDCLGSKKTWIKDDKIMEMFFNGRHYKLTYIFTMQYPLGITPELRSNFDYIFILAEDFTSNIKKLYEQYAGMFPNLDAFRQVFKMLTQDYGAMVIVNRGAHADFLDKVFWFKAKNTKPTNFGSKQYKKYNEDNFYGENWKEHSKPVTGNSFMDNKKRGTKINVLKKTKHNYDDDD